MQTKALCFRAIHPEHSFVLFVRSSIRLVRYCYHDISWTAWAIWKKLTGNNH